MTILTTYLHNEQVIRAEQAKLYQAMKDRNKKYDLPEYYIFTHDYLDFEFCKNIFPPEKWSKVKSLTATEMIFTFQHWKNQHGLTMEDICFDLSHNPNLTIEVMQTLSGPWNCALALENCPLITTSFVRQAIKDNPNKYYIDLDDTDFQGFKADLTFDDLDIFPVKYILCNHNVKWSDVIQNLDKVSKKDIQEYFIYNPNMTIKIFRQNSGYFTADKYDNLIEEGYLRYADVKEHDEHLLKEFIFRCDTKEEWQQQYQIHGETYSWLISSYNPDITGIYFEDIVSKKIGVFDFNLLPTKRLYRAIQRRQYLMLLLGKYFRRKFDRYLMRPDSIYTQTMIKKLQLQYN